MEDLSLRNEFRHALDAVTPPAPWLAANVRTELRRRHREQLGARQRRRFGLTLSPGATRLLAIALVVLLLVAVGGAFLAIHRFVLQPIPIHPHLGAVSRSCASTNVDMITAKVGWQGTARTTDGGTTWRDVSPPAIPVAGKGGGTVCALDANHAWVTEATNGSGCSGKGPCAGPMVGELFVMSTADGGATWRTSQPIRGSGPSTELDFFDDLHGWLLTDSFASNGSNRSVRDLFATSDGGINWALKASGSSGDGSVLGNAGLPCNQTGLTFSSLTTGWLTWDCAQGPGTNSAQVFGPQVVAVTRDGGATWRAVSLPSTDLTCGAMPPIFSAKVGVLLVTCPSGTLVYRTADAGQTWLAGASTPTSQVDFVDGATGFYFAFDRGTKLTTLYSSTDGGRVWAVVKAGLFAGRNVNDFQFIDATTGFANVSNSPIAWVTHDGGKNWALPAPYRSIGNQICNVPVDPGAGAAPIAVKMFNATSGWAAGARRTTDGGADWTNVGPPSAPYRSAYGAGYYLDPDHAWIAEVAGSSTACADRVVVFSTADGGATWRHGAAVTPAISGGLGNVSIDFVDSNNGWLLIGPRLYTTSDAGHTWSLVSADVALRLTGCSASGSLYFSSRTTGWMQVQCNNASPSLAVTHDGGANWSAQTIVKSQCCPDSTLPSFFDSADGAAVDWDGPLLVMTTDGGLTWVRHGLPRLSYFTCIGKGGASRCSNQYIVALSFTNPNRGWAIVTNDLSGRGGPFSVTVEQSKDGGKTWINARADLPRVNSFSDQSQWNLTFIDSNTGFLWVGPKLFATSDGGHTWKRVHVTFS
ncbi:MAG TPA: hypothetical protein VGJ79_02830 [Candidatus Dormibacteraeota bacterium]